MDNLCITFVSQLMMLPWLSHMLLGNYSSCLEFFKGMLIFVKVLHLGPQSFVCGFCLANCIFTSSC